MRENLIELIRNVRRKITAWHTTEDIADMLIANDVVPVVRCKDCKYRGDDVHCPMCFEEVIEIDEGDGYWDTDYITHDRTIDEGFCDRGERKDNETD